MFSDRSSFGGRRRTAQALFAVLGANVWPVDECIALKEYVEEDDGIGPPLLCLMRCLGGNRQDFWCVWTWRNSGGGDLVGFDSHNSFLWRETTEPYESSGWWSAEACNSSR